MDGASSDQKRHPIAQQRAQHFKQIGQQSTLFTRARSQDGQPVTYGKMKKKANITRHSRVMSDPDIPSALVLLNAKGLFQGKNGNGTQRTEQESRTGSIDIMDKDTSRPVFFDPSTVIKETKVCDLRKRFEAVEHDISGGKVNTGREFLNPLHKVNRELGFTTAGNKSTRNSIHKDLEKVLSAGAVEYDTHVCDKGGTGSEFLNPLHKVNQDLALNVQLDGKSKKNVQKKLEKVLSVDAFTKHSTSPPEVDKVVNETVSAPAVKESASRNKPLPCPPPRLPKRYRGESDPMPLDENRVSRIVHVRPQESLEESVEGENLLAQQQNSETEDVASGNDGNDHDDEDDDDDDDEWDTDFDDDNEDDDEERVKRDSQSSHGSSCGAETLVSYIYFIIFKSVLNPQFIKPPDFSNQKLFPLDFLCCNFTLMS